ncbi:hypothetical protein Tco_0848750 [Tanacetum coccineum]
MFQQHQDESLYDACTRFKNLIQRVPHHGLDLWSLTQFFYDHVDDYTRMDLDFAADGNLRELSGEEAWEAIENFAQGQKEWDNPPNIISEQEVANLKAQEKRLFGNEDVWVEMHRNIAWDKVENPNPQSTPQVPPSFEETTPPVTHPEEVDETIGIPTEVEPLDYTKLEDIGLNTCSHDLFLSSRELPSVDEPEPQLLPNFSPLDVNLGDKRGTGPPINPYSPGSFRIKVEKPICLRTSKSQCRGKHDCVERIPSGNSLRTTLPPNMVDLLLRYFTCIYELLGGLARLQEKFDQKKGDVRLLCSEVTSLDDKLEKLQRDYDALGQENRELCSQRDAASEENELALERSKSQGYKDAMDGLREEVTQFVGSGVDSLVRKLLSSDEFHDAFAHVASLGINYGVEKGLRMGRTDVEFEAVAHKVSNFHVGAKADFDKALIDFPTTPFPFLSKIIAASEGTLSEVTQVLPDKHIRSATPVSTAPSGVNEASDQVPF